jgi:hypothetical protein
MTRYENIDTDKVQTVAFSIAAGERKKNPEVPVVISPTAWVGEGDDMRAVRFRIDRVIVDAEVPDEPIKEES